MSRVTRVVAREVLDSRGNPTVEVDVWAGQAMGRAIVPSGTSTGAAEALELRDENRERYGGRGVRQAVANIHDIIAPAIVGQDPARQSSVDAILLALDGTPRKSKLGANALLGVSLACAHVAAASNGAPLYEHLYELIRQQSAPHIASPSPTLPVPMTNMISGGLHAGSNMDFQDVLVMPTGAPDYRTALEWIVRIYRRLAELLTAAGYEGRLVGDEGGYGPRLTNNREAVEMVARAIEAAGLRPADDVTIALDVAATHFFDGESYRLAAERDVRLSSGEMIDKLEQWTDEFPITSIEDGLAEEDWDGWRELTARLGDRVAVVGDDLFATNRARLERGIELMAANSVLIKPNQIGTLTETIETIDAARAAGFGFVVSARSGESEDTTIADLAVASAAGLIKIGSVARSERLAKYNRLLRIEEELEPDSKGW